MSKRRLHFIQSSHWDREWFMTFQDYRFRLVGIMDRLLDRIAAGKLAGPFTADGQAIVLEDYLEARPSRREELVAALRRGDIIGGPWYVLPDQFLISGESMIRNIRLGRERIRGFGAIPSNAGFVGDIFGHISQLPQIFSGFGIECAYLWRGTNLVGSRHFLWRGADGTEIPAYRFGPFGYGDFAHKVRHADTGSHRFCTEQAREDFLNFLAKEATHTVVDPILIFDGWDHLEPEYILHEMLPKWIDTERYEIRFSTFDEYQAEVLSQQGRIEHRLSGELREPGTLPNDVDSQWLIPGVLSSRVNLKLENHACETMLCHWAEPFQLFASPLLSVEKLEELLALAWEYLLKNHPHDSLCGCSIDAVHQDMIYRFAQCRRIADRIATESLEAIARNVDIEIPAGGLRSVMFNPLGTAHRGVVELDLELPADWPVFQEFYKFETKSAFRVLDEHGRDVPYQRLAQRTSRQRFRSRPHRLSEGYRTVGVRIAIETDIPPFGYRALSIKPEAPDTPTRHPVGEGTLARDYNRLENEFLRVDVAPNGTVSITDKTNDRVYTGLLALEDCADIGDGWYHGVAQNDEVFHSTTCPAEIAITQNGGAVATIRLRHHMLIPENFDFKEFRRSATTVPCRVENHLTLRKGQPFLEVRTVVHNNASDHRLRMLYPTDVKSERFWTDSLFDSVERRVSLRPDNHQLRELEVETKPQRSWIALSDGEAGLAVVASGLLESTVRDLDRRPIALTLLRSTRKTVYTDGEPDGLLLGSSLEFHTRIVPFSGAVDFHDLTRQGQELAAGIRTVSLSEADIPHDAPRPMLPPVGEFLRLDGPVILTSCRVVASTGEIRLYNPRAESSVAKLDFSRNPLMKTPPKELQLVNLESEPSGGVISGRDGVFEIPMEAGRIVTVSFGSMA